MKNLFLNLLIPLAILCSTTAPSLFDKAAFHATVDGKQVELHTLPSSEITLQVTDYGARVAKESHRKMENILVGTSSADIRAELLSFQYAQ